MTDLIAKLEAATEGSHALSTLIFRRVNYEKYGEDVPRDVAFGHVPAYTESIDAAMTIPVEGETGWSVNVDGDYCEAIVFRDDDGVIGRSNNVATPAIAVCASRLKARMQADE